MTEDKLKESVEKIESICREGLKINPTYYGANGEILQYGDDIHGENLRGDK